MAKNKVSDWDVVANNNTELTGTITLGEGMPPSYVNDAIREMMAQIKQWQSGVSGDDYTINGTLNLNGELKLDSSSGTAGQVLVSQGLGATPIWGNAFVTGMIMLWSGSTSSVPSGWRLCDGGGGTPNLRDRFVVGAGSAYAVNATGGYEDATLVSHNHTVSGGTSSAGAHSHALRMSGYKNPEPRKAARITAGDDGFSYAGNAGAYLTTEGAHTHSWSGTTTKIGESGIKKNLPPYYALAYIMKL